MNGRTLIGGPAPVRIKEEIERSRRLVIDDAKRVQERWEKLKTASEKMTRALNGLSLQLVERWFKVRW